MLIPCFLAAVERKPRTLWACQSVAFMISAKLAPLGRPIRARIFAPLLSGRGVLASLAGAGLAAFLPVLASFLGAGLVLPPLVAFWPLGAPFFWVAPFFEEVVCGRLTVTRYGQPLGGDSFVARRGFGAVLSAAQPSYPAQFVALRSWARLLSNGLDWHARA